VRDYLSTETVGARALLGAVVAALIWANVAPHSYTSVWGTEFSLRIGSWSLHATLREWVNQGLMTFFFLVVGLEAKRELDLGELRERRRLALPVVAAIGGAAGAIIVYLVINAGGPGAHGWGTAMSTDTAFALGILALIARRGERLRVFLLSLAVVDDDVQIGDQLTLLWGESEKTGKTSTEPHRQAEIRVRVSPTPYAREAREHYADSWRTKASG